MTAAVFSENLRDGMGMTVFVALLATLRNKSFSATQFTLLSTLSAVSRVYADPIAGRLVKVHGWLTFYLPPVFTVISGLMLLLICRRTLEHS